MNYQVRLISRSQEPVDFPQTTKRISFSFASLAVEDMTHPDRNRGRWTEMRSSVKRKRGNSGGSESRERKSSKPYHHSVSVNLMDSLSFSFSSLTLLGDASSQVEMRQGVKRRHKQSGRSEMVERKRRRLELQTDSSIDSLTSAFSCLYISTPPAACGETPAKDSRKDEGQFGRSHLSNSEVRPVSVKDEEQPGPSRPVKLDQGVKRTRENYGRTVSSERKRTKLDPDFYPPAPHGEAYSSDPGAETGR